MLISEAVLELRKPALLVLCMYVYVYVHTHTHTQTHTHTHTHIYIYGSLGIYLHKNAVTVSVHNAVAFQKLKLQLKHKPFK
jgi:hypothetical protein